MDMNWYSRLSVIALCALPLLLAACSDSSVRGSGDDDNDADTGTDTNTSTDSPCSLSELETFDTEIPSGWTVVDGGTSAVGLEDITGMRTGEGGRPRPPPVWGRRPRRSIG